MPLLNFLNRHAQQAGNAGEIGKLDYRIGNPTAGQGVFLTGTTTPIDTVDDAIAFDGFESVSVSTTAVTLTEGFAVGHEYALVTVADGAVRFRLDNLAPTASVGHLLNPNDVLRLTTNEMLDRAQFISKDGVTATLSVSYGNRR